MYHILLIVDFYPPHKGGVETVFEQYSKRLIARGHRISLITTRFDKNLPVYEEVGSGSHGQSTLKIYRVGTSRKSFLRHAFFKGRELLRTDKSIDLIHTSTYGGAIPASLLAKFFHKKILITVHEVFGKLRYYYKGGSGCIYHLFEKLLFCCHFDIYHCVSRYTCNCLRLIYGIGDEKLHVIYNGVDEAWQAQTLQADHIKQRQNQCHMEGKCNLLYFGHAGFSKGLDFLIQALPAMHHQIPHFQFICVLLPSKRKNLMLQGLQALATPVSGQAINIILLEEQDQDKLKHLVAAVDIVIVPSLSEGFGCVVSEVSTLGKPLVTTSVSAIPEAASGMLRFIPPAHTQAIVDGVVNAWQKKGGEHIPPKTFDWNESTKQLEKLYEGLMNH